MTVTQFIGYKILNTAAITAYTSTRVYHGNIPEGVTTYPTINYFIVDNLSVNMTTMYRTHIQISCRAETPEQCMNLAYEVIDAFFEYQDTLNGFDCESCYYDNSHMIAEDDTVYHVPIDIYVLHRRS